MLKLWKFLPEALYKRFGRFFRSNTRIQEEKAGERNAERFTVSFWRAPRARPQRRSTTGALTMPHMVVESGEPRKERTVRGGLSGEY